MKRPIRKYLIVLISGVLVVVGVLAAVLLSNPKKPEEAPSGDWNTSSEAPSSAGKEETETEQETTETSTEAAVEPSSEEPEASSVDEETTSQLETEAPSFTEPTTVEEPFVYKAPDEIIDTSTTCYTYEMMQADLQYLAKAYPDRLRLFSAGTTEDGRKLSCAILGNPDAPRQIYVCAATHAREYMTAQLVMRQLAYYCTEYDSGTYNGRSFHFTAIALLQSNILLFSAIFFKRYGQIEPCVI